MRMEGDSFIVPCGVTRYLHRNELSVLLKHTESPDADLMAFLTIGQISQLDQLSGDQMEMLLCDEWRSIP